MAQKEKNFLILYIIFIVFFIILTNNFYSFEQALIINQYDGVSYMNIANSSFYFSEDKIPYHHAQRFYIPFFIGLIGNSLSIDNFFLFKIFTYISLILIIYIQYLLILKSNCNFKTAFMFISLVILNPYITRYFLSVPAMVNDVFFILGLHIFLYGLFQKNYLIFMGAIVSMISRQTGIFVFFSCFFYLFQNKMLKLLIYNFLIFISIILLSIFYAKNSSISDFDFDHLFGLIKKIFIKKELIETLKWSVLPLYSFLPIILFSLSRKKLFEKLNFEKIILLFLVATVVGITLLAGPDLTGRNIIRLTSSVLPVIAVYLIFFSESKIQNKTFSLYEKILILIIFISSFHPVFSKIKFLELIKIL